MGAVRALPCLGAEDAPQREHSLRAVFNALRYLVRCGVSDIGDWIGALPPQAQAARAMLYTMVGDPQTDRDALAATSPYGTPPGSRPGRGDKVRSASGFPCRFVCSLVQSFPSLAPQTAPRVRRLE
jgi:hypothetical protein